MDPLSDVLDLSRVRGALMVSVRADAPWGLDLPQWPGAAFHAITSGTAWQRVNQDEPLQLMPGDVFLLPAGARHRLSYQPRGSCVPFDTAAKERLMTPDGDLTLGVRGATSRRSSSCWRWSSARDGPGLVPRPRG